MAPGSPDLEPGAVGEDRSSAKLIDGDEIDDQERADFARFVAIEYVRKDVFQLQFVLAMMSAKQNEKTSDTSFVRVMIGGRPIRML